ILKGLNEAGFVEGQNVAIEFFWTEGHSERQPVLAVELVRRQMALIVTGTVGGLAAKAATQSVTSHDRASSATVPHLPVTDQSSTQSLSCWPTVSSPGSSTRSVRGATVFGSVRIVMTHEERAVRKLEKFRQCGNYFQWSEKYCCRERHRIDIDVSDAHI